MRRIRSIVLIMTCLLLPGCTQSNGVYTDERFYTDDYLPDYDVSMEYQAGTGNLDKEGSVYYVCAPQTQAWIQLL